MDLTPSFLPRLLRRVAVAAAVIGATTLVPVRYVAAAPSPRLDERVVAAGHGRVDPHFPITHVAAKWKGADDAVVEVRWRSATTGSWSEWQPLEVSHDLEDDATGTIATGLVVVPDAEQAEARAVSGDVRDLTVVSIDARHGPPRWVPAPPPPAAAELNDEATVPQPAIISRREWGADESLRKGTPRFAEVTRMAVHHTAGTNNDPDPAATVRAIYAYHTQSNGWDDIGYNFLVDAQGRIYEGRYARDFGGAPPTGEDGNGNLVIGAHTGGYNTGTVGISLLGTFTASAPTAAAVDSLTRMLAWEADRHSVDPLGTTTWTSADGTTTRTLPTIVGHRDAGQTSCPGDRLWEQLPNLRQTVGSQVAAAKGRTRGYWELARDGRLFAFGEAETYPNLVTSAAVTTPTVAMGVTPTGKGYWLLSGNGRVMPFGDAQFFGSTETMALNAPVVRVEPTRSGKGYWVLGADGGVFSFGDAQFYGSTGAMKLNAPVISMAATPSGKGYWLLAGDGGIFAYGDASFYGSTGDIKLNQPVVSMSPAADGEGYWLVAKDGGVFAFDVPFHGSVPGLRLRGVSPSLHLRSTATRRGYYILNTDGGIFTFGDAKFHGAQAGLSGAGAAADLALLPPA